MKLHLGSGGKIVPGFLNVDIQKLPNVDLVCDVGKLPFVDNSVGMIYSCAVIEHVSRHEWVDVLREWWRVLEPAGVLQLSTADFGAIVRRYLEKHNVEELIGLINGGQKDQFDRHGFCPDFDFLENGLKKAGFRSVRRVRWQEFEPYNLDENYDDYARSYLPHKDFENGRLLMLNVEAEKG